MIVRRADFTRVLAHLATPGTRSLDTETTGLRPYHGDRLFSIIIGDDKNYYFNFNEEKDLSQDWVLPREWLSQFMEIFWEPNNLWYMANAKFDLAMLAAEGLEVWGTVHCTEALGRVENNTHFQYGLDAQAKRIGLEKSTTVVDYIKKHSLYEEQHSPWKELKKKPLYSKVPLAVIAPYGEQDAGITMEVGTHQCGIFSNMAYGTPEGLPSIHRVVESERQFTKTCFVMEQMGIRIDVDYCKQALAFEQGRCKDASQEFGRLTGMPFQDSNKLLASAFTRLGVEYPKTEKGNPSFNDEALQSFNSPVARCIKMYREAHKNASTYYSNFLYFADRDGILHPTIKQGGARTGRISVVDPALQTIPDEEEVEGLSFEVRKAFIPREGRVFVMIDYDQQEYRLMLDYAGQMDLIHEVQNGMDVHAATAKIIEQVLRITLTRSQAKTLNFGLLYGMGKDALAQALNVTVSQAQQLRQHYFQALPYVKGFIRRVITKAESQGYIFNWHGRRYYFNREDAYKGPNTICQGGAGDIMKVAMNQIQGLLAPYKSEMLLSIHDEILLEMALDELFLVPQIKQIMEDVYPHKHLKLTCSVEHSFISWGDKAKGLPDGKAKKAV